MKKNMAQQIDQLKNYYLSKLPDKINAIETGWHDYLNHPSAEKMQILYRQTYNMSGAAGSYGYREIADCAKKINKVLRDPHPLDEKKAAVLTLITKLRSAYGKVMKSL